MENVGGAHFELRGMLLTVHAVEQSAADSWSIWQLITDRPYSFSGCKIFGPGSQEEHWNALLLVQSSETDPTLLKNAWKIHELGLVS